jgi:hypothetical protein
MSQPINIQVDKVTPIIATTETITTPDNKTPVNNKLKYYYLLFGLIIVKWVKNGVLMIIHIYAKVSTSKFKLLLVFCQSFLLMQKSLVIIITMIKLTEYSHGHLLLLSQKWVQVHQYYDPLLR